jgi:hypothetical protein
MMWRVGSSHVLYVIWKPPVIKVMCHVSTSEQMYKSFDSNYEGTENIVTEH